MSAEQGQKFVLNCTTSNPGLNITWLRTDGTSGTVLVTPDDRIHLQNNGYELEFDYIVASDEGYYLCGLYDEGLQSFTTFNSYYINVISNYYFKFKKQDGFPN